MDYPALIPTAIYVCAASITALSWPSKPLANPSTLLGSVKNHTRDQNQVFDRNYSSKIDRTTPLCNNTSPWSLISIYNKPFEQISLVYLTTFFMINSC